MPSVAIPNRSLISITGPDAQSFLQNVVTADIAAIAEGQLGACALLSPQGKILFDFLLFREGESGIGLDCRADAAADLARRLTIYRMRAKAEIGLREQVPVTVSWQGAPVPLDDAAPHLRALRDNRFPVELDVRRAFEAGPAADGVEAWDALRIAHGVAESGSDFALGDAFPHDVLLDQNGGVGFRKGCFVGQEVVSRMQHRGTARRRIVIAESAMPFPPSGTEIMVGGRGIGTLGTVAGAQALALVRIDRVSEARAAGQPVSAGGADLSFRIPPGMRFTFPPAGDAVAE